MRRAVLVSLRTLLISFVAAELFLRFVRPVEFRAPQNPVPLNAAEELLYRRSAVPGLVYELAPNVEKIIEGAWVRTNSHGMRGPEPDTSAESPPVRVAAVGDSFTFGLWVEVEDAYPLVLQRQLNAADGKRYEVLNFGVPGYSTWEEVAVVEHKALPWKPRLIILGYCLNDPETAPLQPLHVHFHPPAWWQHFHLLRFFSLLHITLDTQLVAGGDYVAYLHSPERPKWSSVTDGFERIAALTAARGIPVVVVIFPVNDLEPWSAYRYRPLHHQVAAAARAARLHVLDLADAYAAHDPQALAVAPTDPHPSPLGHRVAAQAIVAAIAERRWLE